MDTPIAQIGNVAPKPHGGKAERLLTLAWSGIENACRQLLSLIFFFASVRFLLPADLGLFSVAVALSAVAAVVIDEPIGESLVQKADTSTADWNTGFTINLALAASFVALTIAAGWPLSWALDEPALRYVLPVLALSMLIGALGNMQKALLARNLRFRSIAKTTLAAQLTGGAASVSLAALGFGYWALVAMMLVVAGTMTVIYYAISPWKPQLQLDPATIASRLPYTIYSIAIRTIYLLRDQSPLIIAGFFVDLTHVGFLSLALRVARSVSQLFEEVTGRPLLSLMAREQHDISQFGPVLIEVLTIVGLFAVPGYVGLAVVGPRLIPLVFGAAWAPAGAFLPWICVVLAGWLVLHIVSVGLRARDLGRVAVQVTAPAAIADVAILAALTPFGLEWALIGWAARALLTLPVAAYIVQKHLGVDLQVLARRLATPLLASALMGVALVYLGHVRLLGDGFAGAASAVAAGCVIYGVAIGAAMPSIRRRALSAFQQ